MTLWISGHLDYVIGKSKWYAGCCKTM